MMHNTTHREAEAVTGSRRGSVLLETVIAIPLFMIMLGGIFWIGDLMVTRQQLVVADRYMAWNKGLRYDDRGQTDPATVHRLFFAEANGAPSRYHQPKICDAKIDKTYDWSHVASGQVRLDMRMPEWTRYMFNAGQVMYESGVPLEQALAMQGRDQPDQRHVVLMRTKSEAEMSYIRNKYGVSASGQVADRWRNIVNEKWAYE